MSIENITPEWEGYELIDSGGFEKLERFGELVTRRPEPQAIWSPTLSEEQWRSYADASFVKREGATRNEERGEWRTKPRTPDRWLINYRYKGMSLTMRLAMTSFKHLGIFPEQAANWNFIYDRLKAMEQPKTLNLFAYTGGASLAAAAAGSQVTHVDSVKQVVSWSRENMEHSGLGGIRWVVEDAMKFVRREVRRGNKYNAIILDPPAYGRGADGERWILEENIDEMLRLCSELLSGDKGSFVVLNLYSMGLSSTLARTAMRSCFGEPSSEQRGELVFADKSGGKELPLGVYYRFIR
ncbi:MAG: class I SAM-dependent methyltransferase [Rikenellaceae bacterium]